MLGQPNKMTIKKVTKMLGWPNKTSLFVKIMPLLHRIYRQLRKDDRFVSLALQIFHNFVN